MLYNSSSTSVSLTPNMTMFGRTLKDAFCGWDHDHGGGSGLHSKSMFVCVEVLQPSQPNGVLLSMVSLPNRTFTGQA